MTARWRALCIDVVDGGAMGAFWAAATGLVHRPGEGDPGHLDGGPEGSLVELCAVPEPVTVKQRVHLDLHVADVADLVAVGATVVDDTQPWTVLTDPEGGELCAFARDEVPAYKVYEVSVDAADPERIARWWAERFGVEARNGGEPWWWLEGVPGAPFDSLVFGPVPEPKTVKNRIHWDVTGSVDDFLAAGATALRDMPRWRVLADPEGNEFCVFPSD